MKAHSITENREAVLSGKSSLKEIVEKYISNIEAGNSVINAYISTCEEEAFKQAEIIQKKILNGTAGPLAGAVFGLKDVFSVREKPLTGASHMLENFVSMFDATVVERLKRDDAIILGRLNMDELAMGSTNETSCYGPVKNPLNTDKVAGGSSGGSAAAIVADMATATLGSDTGGSIRLPAAYCGVVGLKPSYGRVSRYGLMAYASSFDCIGPITHSVEDAALILESIAGIDERDSTSSDMKVEDYADRVRNPNKKIKIGIPAEIFDETFDPEIRKGVLALLDELAADGAELIPVHLPHLKYAIAAYYVITSGEASSNLARLDGIRYGHRADKAAVIEELKREEAQLETVSRQNSNSTNGQVKVDSQLNRLYKKSRGEGFGANVKRRILLGTYVLSSGQYERYYVKAQKIRALIQEDYKKAFQSVDVIASPSTPTTAIDFGMSSEYNKDAYLNDLFSNSANLAGVCAISVPAGMHSDGMPYGIQFTGDVFQESKILNAARLVELKISNK